MSSKTYFKLLAASFLVGIGISLMSCGSSGSSGNPAAPGGGVVASTSTTTISSTANCWAGYTSIDGVHCVPTGLSFEQACAYSYGTIFTSTGTELCRTAIYSNAYEAFGSSNGAVATVTPSTPANPLAFVSVPQMSVNAGDKMTVLSKTGGWGTLATAQQSSCLFGLATCTYWQSGCNITASVNGTGSGGAVSNEGQPAGLFVSDGTTSYSLTSGNTFNFVNAGIVRFGFNAPVQGYNSCGGATLTFNIERCVDTSGGTHPCP